MADSEEGGDVERHWVSSSPSPNPRDTFDDTWTAAEVMSTQLGCSCSEGLKHQMGSVDTKQKEKKRSWVSDRKEEAIGN